MNRREHRKRIKKQMRDRKKLLRHFIPLSHLQRQAANWRWRHLLYLDLVAIFEKP